MRRARKRGWRPVRTVAAGTRVSRVEIFFDLVFVYGFFNISRFLVEDLNAGGLIKGLLMLALLWLCWIGHILVAHRVRLGEGVAPLVAFAAMGAALAIALAIPHAFADVQGGIYGPLLFPICYFLLRSLHLGLHLYAVRRVPEERRLLARVGVAVAISTGLLLLAAALPWLPGDFDHFGGRVGLWTLAVLVEYGSGLVIGLSGWRLASPEHFVERFELIIIIAFGELIISVGIGSGVLGKPITWPTLVSALVGLITVACLWWAYFDTLTHAAALAMHGLKGDDQIALARDGYIYLHLPMIAGLILVALGGEEVLRFMAAQPANAGRPLHGLGAPLLWLGVALYLLSLIGFQLRALGTLVWTRAIAFLVLVALVPLAGRLPSMVALGLLAVVGVGLVIAEMVFLAESRNALRAAVREEREAIEAREDEWRRQHR